MKVLRTIKKCTDVLSQISAYVVYVAILGMVLLTVVDVFLRYVFNSPIVGSYEIVQYLLLVSVFGSFAYCQVLRGHIQVTMIIRNLPRTVVFIIDSLTGIMTTGIVILLGYAASQQAIYSVEQGLTTDTLKIPISPFIWIESICTFIFALVCLIDVVYSIVSIFNKSLQDEVYLERM